MAAPATTLRFHSRLYTRQAINAAAEAYEGFATFAIAKDGAHYVVEITILDLEHEAVLADEFASYVLGETIELKKGA